MRPSGVLHRSRLTLPLGLVTALLASSAAPVGAQDPYGCMDELRDAEVAARLRWIEARFEESEGPARGWYWGFLSGMAALALGQGVVYGISENRAGRIQAAFGGLGSAFVVLQMALFPSLAAFGAGRLRDRPADTAEERRAKLRFATRLLERSAEQERIGDGWLPHAGVVAYTLGVSSILAFGYDDPLRALATFVGAPTIGFGRLITQPTAHRGDWRRYRAMSCGARYVHILDDEPVEADGFEANRPDAEDLQEEPPELPIPSRGEAGWRLIPLLGFGHLGLALLF